jgi:CBS domain-containing protein
MQHRIVPDIISDQNLIELGPDATVREAATLMADNRIGTVLVTKDGKLEGIFTERDITVRIVAQGRDPETTQLSDVMTRKLDIVSPDDRPVDALERMRERGFRHLPVVDGKSVVGIVSIRDLYAEVKRELEDDVRHRDAFIFGNGQGGLP